MKIIDNNIIVNFSITNPSELEETIKSGIEKEIIFTVELIHAWNFWPDEFVVSKQIRKTIKYDNLREYYNVSLDNGIKKTVLFFENYYSLRGWIFAIDNINLANIRGLKEGNYYIRIIVESKSIEQLPFLGLLMLFVPEIEMSLAKESETFRIGGNQ